MTTARRPVLILVTVALLGGSGAATWWIATRSPRNNPPASHATAAQVHKVAEEDLGTVRLSEEAAQRLGVRTGSIERKVVGRARVYGGDVTVPAGRTIIVAAPLGGTLQAPDAGIPNAGQTVAKGQVIFNLLPLLSPELATTFAASKADAEGQVKNAQTQWEAMKLALERAQRLFRDEAGSRRGVEEARAQHDMALRSLEAAEARLAILTKAVGDSATGRAAPLPIESPETGVLRNVSALAGQNVPSGGVLFEVVDLSEVWLRVPVYVGDLVEIARSEPAEIGTLSATPGAPHWNALPIAAPPTANSLAATVDLYYTLDNESPRLIPGQRVSVKLPLVGDAESLCVAWSAVVQDTQGGMWVYQDRGKLAFQRQRVLVRYVVEGMAVLAAGPAPGTQVVTEGAVELFGAETGFSK